jgi:ribosomal protein L35AE/L33A
MVDGQSLWGYRLYSKGRVLGHKRGKRNSRPNTSLIQIEGVADKKEAQFYLGKVRSKWLSTITLC